MHYDPLLAKLIAWGESRDAARRRALAALRSYPILGIRTNTGLLIELLEHPRFIDGALDTGFLDTDGEAIRARLRDERATDRERRRRCGTSRPPGPVLLDRRGTAPSGPAADDPWTSLRGARV